MAEHYVSEEEQVESIKKWLKANSGAIVAGIVIGLAVIFGWQYWTAYQAEQAEQASLQYQTLTRAIEDTAVAKARQQGQVLVEEFPTSPYAALAALWLAKLAVDEGDNAAALEQLQWVIEHASQDELKDIARLRLVRVLLAEGRLDDAEVRLEQVSNPSFTAELEELKGDLYLKRNDPLKARAAYEAARTALGSSGGGTLLQVKLDNLPSPPIQEN